MMERNNTGGLPAFSPEESCVLRLRSLYERRGFVRADTARFEDYALYLDNKAFLGTDRILTFMDNSGRLMAMKPDVTLSIAKTAGEGDFCEKLYYIDEVVRFSPENGAYKASGQIGLERIGREDDFSSLEVLDLALRSLSLIGESAMDISHQGFVSGLLEDAELSPELEREILAAIHSKSIHDVAAVLDAGGVSGGRAKRILTLAGIQGPFHGVLEQARPLVRGKRMARAYEELLALSLALKPSEGQALNLDFSVVNALDYYNGLIFRGYIRGIPGVVCSGGRYDSLMVKLGKNCGAIGFGVSLRELASYYGEDKRHPDILLVYSKNCDWAALLRRVEELNAQGLSVRCEREDSDISAFEYGKRIDFGGGEG